MTDQSGWTVLLPLSPDRTIERSNIGVKPARQTPPYNDGEARGLRRPLTGTNNGMVRLEIFWGQTGSLRDSGEHLRPDLLVVVEREHEVVPIRTSQCAMRAGLAFQLPTDLQQGGERSPGLRRRPVAQAAWNVTFRNSAGASR